MGRGIGLSGYIHLQIDNIINIFKDNMNGMNLQDQMLKTYIETVFNKYDTDRSGTLDEDEMTNFFNDLFQSLGIQATVNKEQAL